MEHAARTSSAARKDFGQWLRWEAALEEMRLYYSVPKHFREEVHAVLAGAMESFLAASPGLSLLSLDGDPGSRSATIFPVSPQKDGVSFSPAQCAAIYRAMRRDLSGIGGNATGKMTQQTARALVPDRPTRATVGTARRGPSHQPVRAHHPPVLVC